MTLAISGVQLLGTAERMLDRSARTFARAGATAESPAAAAPPGDASLVAAAVAMPESRTLARIGTRLIQVEGAITGALLDVLA